MNKGLGILIFVFQLFSGTRGVYAQNVSASSRYISKVWVSDQGNGTYKNPVLNADYSDPDAIRVGDDFYLVSSSFEDIPGLPILHSKDLVNWKILTHAFRDCLFDTGDDCIAIKSGRDEDERAIGRPAENYIIEGCTMKDGHGGVVLGSEISGGVKNIYAVNCMMDSPELERVLRLKTSSSRGGIIENIFMKDIKVGTYRDVAVTCNMFYENPCNFMPTIRNIWVENMKVLKGGNFGIYVHAYKESPVENLRLVNCNITGVKTSFQVDHVKDFELLNVIINGKTVLASGGTQNSGL